MDKFLIPEGARDLLLEECEVKEMLVSKASNLLKRFGYEEVITPTIEFYKTFNNEDNGFDEEDIYKFFDNKGRILVLRPDMTVPISRVVSTKFKDRQLPLRIRYTSNVFRVNESLGGKRNEYTDCGVELIGFDEKQGDLEILVTALELLTKLKVKDFKLEIGNINLFKESTRDLNLSKDEKKYLGELVEKKSLKSLEDYLEGLNLKKSQKKFFLKLPWLFGDKDVLESCRELAFNDGIRDSIDKLKDTYDVLDSLGYGELISFDLGMAPRLNYYTGIIFRGYVSGVGTAVLSGGRYDNLLKNFGEDLKAIGFSLNMDLLIGNTESQIDDRSVYKIYYNEQYIVQAFNEAKYLREQNYVVKLIPDNSIKDMKIEEEGAI
ncbi:MAG: ATP phosphoribosyltransferase regulatory subunit [Clostridium sp.]